MYEGGVSLGIFFFFFFSHILLPYVIYHFLCITAYAQVKYWLIRALYLMTHKWHGGIKLLLRIH
jgi:hypothetical protein